MIQQADNEARKAVLYARFSPTARENCASCDVQVERMKRLCHALDHQVVAVERDDYLSGGKDDRPGLQAALAKVKKVKGILMVYKFDRLARKARLALEIAEELQAAGCDLCSLTEQIDTSTPHGRMIFGVLAVVSQMIREEAQQRTKEYMHDYQIAGRRMGRVDRPPYGWQVSPTDPKWLAPVLAEQAIIGQIMQMAPHMSLRRVCIELDKRGILRRNGGTWSGHHQLLGKIVKREAERYGGLDNAFRAHGVPEPAPVAEPSAEDALFLL